jgi:hypothetical protein
VSTHNDSLFYCSSNLSTVETYLNEFKSTTEVNEGFINDNIRVLN